jgi:acetyl-CoA carboxylase carboxyl transferase subunit beta
MSWFRRTEKGINTPTELKRETPDGLWYQCPECKNVMHTREHKQNAFTCIHCNYHDKIGSEAYFNLLFDEGAFTELDKDMISGDPLKFVDTKAYPDRIKTTVEKSGLKDACRTAYGKMHGQDVTISCMDFGFIGGSMGSVVGEKIARGISHAIKTKTPFLMISKSGGARMMEAGFSLMQMAKTSAKLALLEEAKLPYISLLTDPTTGGVTASFAMLGDFNVAEPGSLIGFAGPRIIKETIGKDLPKGDKLASLLALLAKK